MSESPPNSLRLLFWESTSRCNLACAHCRRLDVAAVHGGKQRPPWQADEDLSTEQVRRLMDSAAGLGRPIFVFSGGEPLLREDWQELAGYARRKGLPTALATNGTLIERSLAEGIAQAGFGRVSVSLDAAEADRHDTFRGRAGAFEGALAGIAALRAASVPVQVNSTIHAGNFDRLDALYDLSARVGAEALHLFVLVPVGCGLELARSSLLSPRQCETVLEWVIRRQAAGGLELKATCAPQYVRLARHWLERHPEGPAAGRVGALLRGRGCLAGAGVLFVAHDGEVFPCGYLPVSCGNVRRQDLETIWNHSDVLSQLRDYALLTGRCGRCTFKTDCGGCRARAFAATGDYLGEEPSCSF